MDLIFALENFHGSKALLNQTFLESMPNSAFGFFVCLDKKDQFNRAHPRFLFSLR